MQWDYGNVKAAYRQGTALVDAGELQEAARNCQYASQFAKQQDR